MSDEFDDPAFDDHLFDDPETLARVEAAAVKQSARRVPSSKSAGPVPTHKMVPPAASARRAAVMQAGAAMRGRGGAAKQVGRAPETKLAPLPYVARNIHLSGDAGSDDDREPPEIVVGADGRYAVAPAPKQDLAPRRPLARSTSMHGTGSQQASQNGRAPPPAGATHRSSQSIPGQPVARAPAFPGAPRTFAREPSVGSLQRRAAMESALGLPPSQAAREVRDERERSVEVAGWSARAIQEIKEEQAIVPEAAEQLKKEIGHEAEQLRKEVIQLAAARKAADDDIKAKQMQIYALRGEADSVRRKMKESESAHAEREQAIKKQLAEMQELLAREKATAQRQLQAMESEHIFKLHNSTHSAKKPHLMSTQRPMASQAQGGRGTPSRRPSHMNGGPLATPSKSPTGRRGKGEGVLGPEDFATPFPLRKNKQLKDTPAAASPAFKGLRNTFIGVDSAIGPARKKTKLDEVEGGMDTPSRGGTQARLSPMHGMDVGHQDAWNAEDDAGSTQQDDVDMADEDEDDVFGENEDERDVRAEVVSAVFHHISLSAAVDDGDGVDLLPTVQKILHLRLTAADEGRHALKYEQVCTRLIVHLSSLHTPALQLCLDLLGDLCQILLILSSHEVRETVLPEMDVACAVMDMLVDMQLLLPVWQEAVNLFHLDPPMGILLLVVGHRFQGTEYGLAHCAAFGKCLSRLISCLAYTDNPSLQDLFMYLEDSSELAVLLRPEQPFEVIREAVDATYMLATHKSLFRRLLVDEPMNEDSEMPILDALCRHLLQDHASKQDSQTTSILRLKIIAVLSVIASRHRDAPVLLGRGYFLVPTLVKLMERLSEAIWGLAESVEGPPGSFALLSAAVGLLHYLVFPPRIQMQVTSSSQSEAAPPGVDLLSKLRLSFPGAARNNQAAKEFNGLHHSFIVAIGRISYAELTEAELGGGWTRDDIRALQYQAQDLLESVVEGPEADSIYELYVPPSQETAKAPIEGNNHADADDTAWAVEAAQAADDDVIVID